MSSDAPVGWLQGEPPRAVGVRRRGRWRYVRLIVAGVLLALAGFGVYMALLAHDVWTETMTGRTALNQGIATLGGGQVADLTPERLWAATVDFQRAERSLARARGRLGVWGDLALSHGGLLPGPARQLQSVAPLLDLGRETARAAATLSAGLRPVGAVLENGAPGSQGVIAAGPASTSDGTLARGSDAGNGTLARGSGAGDGTLLASGAGGQAVVGAAPDGAGNRGLAQQSGAADRVVAEAVQGGASAGTLAQLTEAMEATQPALAAAQAELAAARAARARLAGLPLVAGAGSLLATFDGRVPELVDALTYARALPDMLGAHGPRSYLLVYQDTADLRATGGFIGSASLIVLDHGRLSQIDYESSGEEPGPNLQLPDNLTGPPPEPLFYYRELGSFQLRDANFWPDFPSSAARIADLYRRRTGTHLDGVVALNPATISYLLQGLGPLAIPGYGETLTAANAVQRIEYYVHDRPGAHADPHRKRFVIAVNHAVLNALLQAGRARLSAVLPPLERAFADRSIMASATDPVFARALHLAHWDGALRGDGGDYLAVFDQNVTDSKLNPFVDQQISYDATRRSDGGLDSRVTVTYANHTAHTAVWIGRTYYQDYVRIAVPGASRLRDQVGYDDTFWPDESERGRRLITGGLLVPAGATRTISISYTVPASALAGGAAYTLVVQKQSGSRPALLSVRVHAGGKTWAARTWLGRDTVFSVPWEAPAGDLRMHAASGSL